MKRIVLSLMLLLASGTTILAQPDYIQDYHAQIQKAEMAIADSNYGQALALYQNSFKAVPHTFAKDYFNAAVCASKLRQYEEAVAYCYQLAEKGVSKEFLDSHKGLEELRQSGAWKKFDAKSADRVPRLGSFEEAHKTFLNDKIRELSGQVKSMQKQYQEQRKSAYAERRKEVDKMYLGGLQRIISKTGFPDENKLGVEDPSVTFSPFHEVLWHNRKTQDEPRNNFDIDYLLAVRNGQMNPHEAITLVNKEDKIAYSVGNEELLRLVVKKPKKTVFVTKKYSNIEKQIINDNRLKFGLGTYEDFRKIAAFNLYDADAEHFILTDYGRYEEKEITEEQYNEMLKEYKPLR